VYGMEWHVKLLLRPGSTVLEERVRLRNRSDVRHRFYWWNNAAVRVSDDSKMAPIVDAPRAEYLVGTAYATCGRTQEAEAKFQVASKASTPDQVLWAWLAAQKLPGFDGTVWQERLQSASADAEGRTQTSSFASWWHYTAGALQAALGNRKEADTEFEKAFLVPDRMMSYHCTRLARAEGTR